MAPDTDFLLKFFSDTLYLQHHRGLTHSMLMLPLWAWLVFAATRRYRGLKTLSPLLIGAALLLHILLDLITSFGTMIFAPLSDWRAALDLVFIIDPLFTTCLLLPLLISLLWTSRRRLLAICSLLLMLAYLSLTTITHQQALTLTRQANPDAVQVAALPMPFSPFHWQLIATYPAYYRRSAVDLWPAFPGSKPLLPTSLVNRYHVPLYQTGTLIWQQLAAMGTLPDQSLPGMAFYRWFARFPVVLEQDAEHIECGDLRFGAGVAGIKSSFRLSITLKDSPTAWLVWRDDAHSELTTTRPPFHWLHQK